MSKTTIEQRSKLYQNGKQVHPFIPDRIYSDSFGTGYNKLTVTGSAANEVGAITDSGTIKELELRVDPASDLSKITVKYNGSSTAYSVSPISLTTGNITAITFSNSSTSAVDVFWRAIYE